MFQVFVYLDISDDYLVCSQSVSSALLFAQRQDTSLLSSVFYRDPLASEYPILPLSRKHYGQSTKHTSIPCR